MGKDWSLQKNHLERSSKAGERSRWDVSAKYKGLPTPNTEVGFGSYTLTPIYGISPEGGWLMGRLNDDSLEHGSDGEPVGDGHKRPAGSQGGRHGRRVQRKAGRRCHHAGQQRLLERI